MQIHGDHTTQEEDIVSNWLLSAARGARERDKIFRDTIDGRWGMQDVNSKSVKT